VSGGFSIDAATLAIVLAVGVGAGVLVSYLVFYRKPSQAKVQITQRDQATGETRRKTVTVDELERSKREMRTLLLERDLLSATLTKIYEAESDGKITREEREMIARRYSSQIREFEASLRDKELIVEVGELETLRDDLLSLFKEKIQNIESRLDQAKERLQPMRQEIRTEVPRQMPRSVAATVSTQASAASTVSPTDDLERVVERKTPSRKDESEGERRVKALRDEVMEALAKLEQIDTKKENEAA
jgi:MFS superfamily sulfate permease-like transporter